MASKAAAVNFHKILSSGIGKETGAQLAAFRKRSEEARRALNQLKAQPVTVDFAAYKGVLKVRGSTCAWHDRLTVCARAHDACVASLTRIRTRLWFRRRKRL